MKKSENSISGATTMCSGARTSCLLPSCERNGMTSNLNGGAKETALADQIKQGDMAAAVDLVLQRESGRAGSDERLGYQTLSLRPPERSIFRKVPRRLSDVNPKLLDLWKELVSARAPWPLYLHGPVGTGKTFAALAFSDLVRYAEFFTVEQLCNRVMKGEQPWEGRLYYETVPLLILDELGEREKVTDLQYTSVKSTVDYREFHANRVAVYISNLAPEDLAGLFDDRIASRITAGSVFRLDGPDRRKAR